jgi:hypothetical protein
MERTLLALVAGLCLLLSGCLEEPESPQACRYAVNLALSQGDWERALVLLESRNCEPAFTFEERQMNYAAAYTGRAGFDLPELAGKIIRHSQLETAGADPHRLLRLFVDFRPQWNSLTDLQRAQQHHLQALRAPDALSVCRRDNLTNLSRLQLDACFYFGVLGIVQALSGFSMLIPDQLDLWLDPLAPRSCAIDNNRSGLPDEAEATACALQAADDVDARDSDFCPTAELAGSVSWQRLPGRAVVPFYDNGEEVARATPLRIDLASAGSCTDTASRYRLLRTDGDRSLVLTTGYCSSIDIRQSCSAADPDGDCWPCPVLLPERGALGVYRALLRTLNADAEALFEVTVDAQREKAREEIDRLKADICERVAERVEGCSLDEAGRPQINSGALRAYLRQHL